MKFGECTDPTNISKKTNFWLLQFICKRHFPAQWGL